MPTLHAQIQTERAGRYLAQFCRHAAAMGGGHTARLHPHGPAARREVRVAAEWSDTSGTVTFTRWGECTLTADADTLTVRIDARDEEGLTQIRDIVTRDFERFSRRDPLTVTWLRQETPGALFRHTGAVTSKSRRGLLRSGRQTVVLALAVALLIGLHVGVAGTVIAESRWTAAAVDIAVALIVLKIALITWARLRVRHRKAAGTSEET
ncbi:DUF2218 domain-containing protein [Microbispora catharanthi]|uniref:DUF2218 domain-containing protein n=1 Tax=Microbispora catharanthi TaxID=1712871 RepID=A0A5N6BXK9_9ACTN|nr:DUF2218 domain-containing protein [Microbispora catharanthi]KAB8185256.1 DUF2218 domain-containing protein [Microbispora catharanthi]